MSQHPSVLGTVNTGIHWDTLGYSVQIVGCCSAMRPRQIPGVIIGKYCIIPPATTTLHAAELCGYMVHSCLAPVPQLVIYMKLSHSINTNLSDGQISRCARCAAIRWIIIRIAGHILGPAGSRARENGSRWENKSRINNYEFIKGDRRIDKIR